MTDRGMVPAREQAYVALRSDVVRAWGEARAKAVEATLRKTADAIWKLSTLEFEEAEKPGFFLNDAARPDGKVSE